MTQCQMILLYKASLVAVLLIQSNRVSLISAINISLITILLNKKQMVQVVIHCVGRPIAVDWALSKDRYEKCVEHSGRYPFEHWQKFVLLLALATVNVYMLYRVISWLCCVKLKDKLYCVKVRPFTGKV